MKKFDFPINSLLIIELNKHNGRTMESLPKAIGITKMGVLKHLKELEEKGVITSWIFKKMGRPYFKFYLIGNNGDSLASSSDLMLESLISFLDNERYKAIAIEFIKSRYDELLLYYKKALNHYQKERRLEELVRLRMIENYFPELRKTGRGKYELLEFNCPIFKISRHFGIACEIERELFEKCSRCQGTIRRHSARWERRM
jgi:Predicted transcriptional regulator